MLSDKFLGTPKKRKRLLILSLSLSVGLGLGVQYTLSQANSRWLIEDLYYRAPLEANLTLAPDITAYSQLSQPLQAVEINDASQIYPVTAAGVLQPRSLTELKGALQLARQSGHSVSLSGARHSMGGQNLGQGMIHLDMMHYNRMHYQAEDQSIRVESGATWKQIQRLLSEHGRSVRVMQDSNIFTVGGSLSANVHGKDPRYGSLIESVIAFDLLTPDGQLLHCSRDLHSDLFRAVIGGMGLLGIITEVQLKTDPNASYQYQVSHLPTESLIAAFEKLSQNPDVELVEAQLSIDQNAFLSEAQLYSFHRSDPNPELKDDLSGEQNIWLRKMIYRFSRSGDSGRRFRWWVQKEIGPKLDPEQVTRNSAMTAPYRLLQLQDPDTTDILQEYFIPTAQVSLFLEQYADLMRKHQLALQNVTVRKTIQDTEALVAYAQTDMYAFVSYYQIKRGREGEQQMQGFTKDLVKLLNQLKGTFYLAYQPYGTQLDLLKMYPNLPALFALKQRIDPEQILSNEWYRGFKNVMAQ